MKPVTTDYLKNMVAREDLAGVTNGHTDCKAVKQGKIYKIDFKGFYEGNVHCVYVLDVKTGKQISNVPKAWLSKYFRDIPFKVYFRDIPFKIVSNGSPD